MAQSVITSAFERLKAQEAAGGNRIIIDQFIFANIPGLNIAGTPPASESVPPDAQIVHRQDVDRNGMVNENTVAYSVTLPESVGDFTFNWMGLVSRATNTLCMAVYLHPQKKIKTADGKQGNTLIYSEIMEYAGASAATGITTPVSTWQIDFTARLHGMDEATRKAALDIYGPGLFFDDAFKLTATATGKATFAPGIAYLRGLRVELDTTGTLTQTLRRARTQLTQTITRMQIPATPQNGLPAPLPLIVSTLQNAVSNSAALDAMKAEGVPSLSDLKGALAGFRAQRQQLQQQVTDELAGMGDKVARVFAFAHTGDTVTARLEMMKNIPHPTASLTYAHLFTGDLSGMLHWLTKV